jgi:hypothetical protein
MDYELWGKFFLAGARVEYTEVPVGMFRIHQAQKTQDHMKQTQSLLEAAISLACADGALPFEKRREILADLHAYREAYPRTLWKQSGRLARMGLPQSIVTRMRCLRDTVQKTVDRLTRPAEEAK